MKWSTKLKVGTLVLLTGVGTGIPSQAGNEGWAALGGFIGGLAIGSSSSYNTTTVRVYEPQVRYRYHEPVRHYEHRPRRATYRTVTRKVWVPGGWVHHRDRCGRPYKVWQNGYYETVSERVRVASHRQSCDW